LNSFTVTVSKNFNFSIILYFIVVQTDYSAAVDSVTMVG